ncbi:MAG: hypothetical protein HC907_34775 [Richelia sp. SM1_7_0]|nr:hypothetical protein [Richelia sp. SM1_7_0]NJR19517.1 hypothetical protein [Calothrix sp. CSU_2_0]
MPTINKEREIRIAQRRVEGFAQQFGEAHRNLARHAAFPLVLTPDLLYQIWANFVPEAPWTAVAHVLLSRLCRQVGYEMYEMDIADRNLLLRELKGEFGQERFDELGEFLLDYVAQRLTDDDADTRDLREAQEWTALAYTKPSEAVYELADKLRSIVTQENITELFRLTTLVKTFTEPLEEAGFEPLLSYSLGIESFARENLEDAVEHLGEILQENSVEVAGVTLPIPELVKVFWREHYSKEFEQSKAEQENISSVHNIALCSNFIIAVGGIGAKCVEAIVHLASIGLFTEEAIGILFIDADEANGNLERARNCLRYYQEAYELMSAGDKKEFPWMKTRIESFNLWSPFTQQSMNKGLKTFFNYNTIKQNQPGLGSLFDVLYTQEEREVSLDIGFRGRPAIGSAVMSQVDLDTLDEEPWGSLIRQIEVDIAMGKSPKVFGCDSFSETL